MEFLKRILLTLSVLSISFATFGMYYNDNRPRGRMINLYGQDDGYPRRRRRNDQGIRYRDRGRNYSYGYGCDDRYDREERGRSWSYREEQRPRSDRERRDRERRERERRERERSEQRTQNVPVALRRRPQVVQPQQLQQPQFGFQGLGNVIHVEGSNGFCQQRNFRPTDNDRQTRPRVGAVRHAIFCQRFGEAKRLINGFIENRWEIKEKDELLHYVINSAGHKVSSQYEFEVREHESCVLNGDAEELIQLLLDKEVNVNYTDENDPNKREDQKNKRTPLLNVVRSVIGTPTKEDNENPRRLSVPEAKKIIKILLENDAEINHLCKYGRNALHWTIIDSKGYLEENEDGNLNIEEDPGIQLLKCLVRHSRENSSLEEALFEQKSFDSEDEGMTFWDMLLLHCKEQHISQREKEHRIKMLLEMLTEFYRNTELKNKILFQYLDKEINFIGIKGLIHIFMNVVDKKFSVDQISDLMKRMLKYDPFSFINKYEAQKKLQAYRLMCKFIELNQSDDILSLVRSFGGSLKEFYDTSNHKAEKDSVFMIIGNLGAKIKKSKHILKETGCERIYYEHRNNKTHEKRKRDLRDDRSDSDNTDEFRQRKRQKNEERKRIAHRDHFPGSPHNR